MKEHKNHNFKKLSSELIAYLQKLSYSTVRLNIYRSSINQIYDFMKKTNHSCYSSEVCELFIESIIGSSTYQHLKRRSKDTIRCANALLEFQNTGAITFRSIRKHYNFEGDVGKYILNYLDYRKSQNLAEKTLNSNRIYLSRFLDYMTTHNISKLSVMKKQDILAFIGSLGFYSKATLHCTLSSLRGFLKFLYDRQHINEDLAYFIPKDNYKNTTKLPTTYSRDEVERLIHAVDQSSPKGKRDVAMILLAARLGLRASDICGLMFENMIWEKSVIILTQSKTGKQIELPSLEDVGNAIIDYIKHGRPQSELAYIFIRVQQPYQKLEEPTLHSIVSFYLRRAGINRVKERRHGPHALRHSLAGFLLENKTPLPVISQVLGHTNTESTNTYLRVNMTSLKQCTIEVPFLYTSFYKEC